MMATKERTEKKMSQGRASATPRTGHRKMIIVSTQGQNGACQGSRDSYGFKVALLIE